MESEGPTRDTGEPADDNPDDWIGENGPASPPSLPEPAPPHSITCTSGTITEGETARMLSIPGSLTNEVPRISALPL